MDLEGETERTGGRENPPRLFQVEGPLLTENVDEGKGAAGSVRLPPGADGRQHRLPDKVDGGQALHIAAALQAHLEFGSPITGPDGVGVGVDEAREDHPTRGIQFLVGPIPSWEGGRWADGQDAAVVDRHGSVGHNAQLSEGAAALRPAGERCQLRCRMDQEVDAHLRMSGACAEYIPRSSPGDQPESERSRRRVSRTIRPAAFRTATASVLAWMPNGKSARPSPAPRTRPSERAVMVADMSVARASGTSSVIRGMLLTRGNSKLM